MTLRRILATTIAAAVLSIGAIAAPASAAPSNYILPKACQASMGKTATAKQLKHYGAVVKKADLLPNKGTEYTYVLHCTDGKNLVQRPVLVIANSSGKALKATVFKSTSWVEITSASKSKGIKLRGVEFYKDLVVYKRAYTAKWNTKSKKVVITKAGAPGAVKATNNLSTQMLKGKKITAVTGTSANLKKLKSYGKKYAKQDDLSAYCTPVSSTKQSCGLVYYSGFKGYFAEFNLTKSGKKYKATSVRTFSSGIAGG